MNEEIKFYIESAKEQMEKALVHLETELTKVRAGKANPAMLEGITVDYYGTRTALNQVASINTQDARSLIVQPWEKSMLTIIEKAIQAANLGFNPQNDGILIRIIVPPLTEERRKALVKTAKAEAENCKVSLRTLRRETNEAIKKLQKNGLPEDEVKDAEAKVQKLTDEFSAKCDKHLEQKEKEILTV
ncbi:MAG TPA: ribosome recycling factor [Bacteroidia bacterium]|nr:ribosome recycling factor [Bacteroidia bacterium]